MSNVDHVDIAVWAGWLGLIDDGARRTSAAPLERMKRIKVVEQTTAPAGLGVNREVAALVAAKPKELHALLDAALAYRTAYEAVLEATDPTLHH